VPVREQHDPSATEGKNVTALFADIKGSMEMIENLDPEEARAIFDPALQLMIEAVRRYGATSPNRRETESSRCSARPLRSRITRSTRFMPPCKCRRVSSVTLT
jgi:class 3 adenylate cyclase